MIDRVRLRLVLGADALSTGKKDDVIAFLIQEGWPAPERIAWYRAWCRAVREPITNTDLHRVQAGRRRELIRSLPWASTTDPP